MVDIPSSEWIPSSVFAESRAGSGIHLAPGGRSRCARWMFCWTTGSSSTETECTTMAQGGTAKGSSSSWSPSWGFLRIKCLGKTTRSLDLLVWWWNDGFDGDFTLIRNLKITNKNKSKKTWDARFQTIPTIFSMVGDGFKNPSL